MTDIEQREAARQFCMKWQNKGNEDQDGRSYWLDILTNILGVQNATGRVDFEKRVKVDGNTKKIDVYIPETRTIIEQKSLGISLDKAGHQSGGIDLTPYQQAKRYNDNLPFDEKAKWIVTCNFAEIWIYDMNTVEPEKSVQKIHLDELQGKYSLLEFLINKEVKELSKEMEISMQAGELVGLLYDALLKQYDNPTPEELESLNILCVRLVFCLYAEDAGVFGKHNMFCDYIKTFDALQMRQALISLFEVLDTKLEERDKYLREDLAQFPYVNGGLFADNGKRLIIPQITDEIKNLITDKAGAGFDWSQISPTIFGAVFESTLNPETRRKGGMHYTSIENIHKVIDPLFLNDLYAEFNDIKQMKQPKTRNDKLEAFCKKLGTLKFLDPACGSGNFLTETYISLRKLENEALRTILNDQVVFETKASVNVTINQFYGIEINDFAVNVAKTALWIAESQMNKETEAIISKQIPFLPLKTNAYIVEGNALRVDWESVVPKNELNYIMGNPPFIGASMMTKEQKAEAVEIFGKIKLSNSIDYVGAWYHKAALMMQNTNIKTALVSTNSITQGEQVAPLWDKLLNEYNIYINFAYRTFRWDSEASLKAHVHCVIIGFSTHKDNKCFLYDNNTMKIVENINPYLVDGPNVCIKSISKPICDVPKMYLGNKPSDGGNLILTSQEAEDIIKKEPNLQKYIKPYVGSEEYINNKVRYCFWLVDINPNEMHKSTELKQRLLAVKNMRENSTAEPTREKAATPHLFFFISQPTTNYLIIPSTSSENRRYIPIGFVSPDIIASNSTTIVPNATLYNFGVLTSNIHMAWMRAVAGRLEMRYRYSGGVVYNTFPWCNPTPEQKAKIEQTAQAILDARAKYPDCSLADLYDELTMPVELRKAHQANDRAVMKAYGFNVAEMNEAECVSELMKMYEKLNK